jgi:eukaryotic-like serine/threonine-protein kinase
MTIQLTIDSFQQLLIRSKLLNSQQLVRVDAALSNRPEIRESAATICDWLVNNSYVTRWQADKLLQARHRGFFLGNYKLRRKIARGGMSSIYLAERQDTGGLVALKVLPLDRADRESWLPRFKREAAIAVRLRHPNIVRVFEVHEESDGANDIHFMAMEYLRGQDLFDIVKREGPLSCRAAADCVRQAALGLQYAHEAGLVHRDVKPGNLFHTAAGDIKLLDLGLAQNFESDENLTREYNERVLGTADYLAPEQAVDSHCIDARADIYALGCTMWYLLTGAAPFPDGSLAQRIIAHQMHSPAPLHSLRSDVPVAVDAIVSRMMEKRPDERPQTASHVASALADWLTTTSGLAEHDRRPTQQSSVPHADASADSRRNSTASTSDSRRDRGDESTNSLRTTVTRPLDSPVLPVPSDTGENAADRPDAPSSPFQPEFQRFLETLDRLSGVDTVLDVDERTANLRRMANCLPDQDENAADPDQNCARNTRSRSNGENQT